MVQPHAKSEERNGKHGGEQGTKTLRPTRYSQIRAPLRPTRQEERDEIKRIEEKLPQASRLVRRISHLIQRGSQVSLSVT